MSGWQSDAARYRRNLDRVAAGLDPEPQYLRPLTRWERIVTRFRRR